MSWPPLEAQQQTHRGASWHPHAYPQHQAQWQPQAHPQNQYQWQPAQPVGQGMAAPIWTSPVQFVNAPTVSNMGYPLGVLPNYTRHPTELALKIKEKRLSWSGDDFTIRDAMTETPIFRVNGKTFTWHGRQQLVDAQGAPLMDISFEPMHFVHSVFNGHDPVTKERLFRIRSKVSFGANLIITFQNKCGPYAGREMELSLKGDFFAREATIQYDGAVIARIDRKFWNSRQFIFDQQSYILTVGPGVDIAFMVALCLCLDQLRDDGGAPANGVGAVIDLAL